MDHMNVLDNNKIISSELVQQTLKYWFSDHNHVRSPFPNYVHAKVKDKSSVLFLNWIRGLEPKVKDEINDEVFGEKFEEIIFETAIDLVKTEDERITLLYPFLPRVGDQIDDKSENESKKNSSIIERELIKEGDVSYLKIVLENENTKQKWETKIELPV
jgi:hypothetical protein